MIAINHEQPASLSSLEVIGEQPSAPTTFRLQKAGVDLVIELSPANGYYQVLEDIAPGRYSLSAVEGCYLYQLDGRSRRHHCTIVFAQDAHTVITPCTDPGHSCLCQSGERCGRCDPPAAVGAGCAR
ncbi:MAG: hypothetical protein ACLVJ6_08205 [Merdibacter sp.]